MSKQIDLFPPASQAATGRRMRRKRADRPSIDQRFTDFHAANPHVFGELLRLAQARLAAGATRIGLKALWEELRASLVAIADGGGPDAGGLEYKLNNNFTALYARMLVRAEPQLETVIEMRRRKHT